MISDNELYTFNLQGLIPGPDESEDDFIKRANYCLDIKQYLASLSSDNEPFPLEAQAPSTFLEEAFPVSKKFYAIEPSWVPLFFSNYQLTPWHGGCAWIFQLEPATPTSAFFQLRKAFSSSSKYLGIYSRQELITHELAHVGRMMFNEPKYEEILAYRSSDSAFRRWFGPIVQSPSESLIFLGIIIMILLADIMLIASEGYDYYMSLMWLKVLPIGIFLFALGRLWLKQHHFKKCLNHLTSMLPSDLEANAVIYRLEDKEIDTFSALNEQEIQAYVLDNKEKSLRWKLLAKKYFHV